MWIRAPVYVCFAVADVAGTGGRPAALPPVADLLEFLSGALVLDVDTEGEGNPHGFKSGVIDWDVATVVTAAEADNPPTPCRDGQRVQLKLTDGSGAVIVDAVFDVNEAADRVREFVLLRGGDPEEAGRGAGPGRIDFAPVKGPP